MQNKTSVFDKKGSNTIWLKQIATWRKKSIDEEKNLLLRALKTYLWGLKEDPITEDPKENPFNEKPKGGPLLLWNLKTTLSIEILRSFRTLIDFGATNWLFLAFW